MRGIETIEELEALYGPPVTAALTKVQSALTPNYRAWIEASRFVVLTTVGPDGTDASPRGDAGPVVRIHDDNTLYLPDWRGNNRLDSLRNIVQDGRASLMFMVPGCINVVRINGTAVLSTEPDLLQSFERDGKMPKTVIVIRLAEVYYQCAKAIMRSRLWSGEDQSDRVPTAGMFLSECTESVDAQAYDDGYADYARPKMW